MDLTVILAIPAFVLAVIAIIAVPRAFSHARQKAELLAKDEIIKTREQTNDALNDRVTTLAQEKATLAAEVEVCRINAKRSEVEAAGYRAKYEEQSKYTAEAALETIEKLIETGDREADRRHTEVMGALGNISVLVGDRRTTPRRTDDDEPLTRRGSDG